MPLAKKQDGGLSNSHGSYQGAASVQRGGGSGKKVAVVGACLVLGALILYGTLTQCRGSRARARMLLLWDVAYV